jgi:hypothetical protein
MNQSIQELIQKNKSHAIDLSEASDIMPKDLKEHQIRIYNAVLDSEYLSNEHLKDLIDAVIESRKKKKKKTIVNMLQDDEMFNERGMDGVKAWNDAQDDTIKELLAIKKLL